MIWGKKPFDLFFQNKDKHKSERGFIIFLPAKKKGFVLSVIYDNFFDESGCF
jgi:hypothetical protein